MISTTKTALVATEAEAVAAVVVVAMVTAVDEKVDEATIETVGAMATKNVTFAT